jgi:hypothetical protein
MTNAQRALALVDHFQRLADAEPSSYRDHGGVEKGWTRTAKADAYLALAHRADRLFSKAQKWER